MPKRAWTSDWTVDLRVGLQRRGKAALDEECVDLLSAIGRTHSITAAAKSIGVSYRKAWNMVKRVNSAAGEPLVSATVGGVTGGGAQLTSRGRMVVEVSEQLRAAVKGAAAGLLHRIVASEPDSDCIHLSAAISLQDVVGQILTEFALLQPAVKVRAVFGASNELADHLLAGAPGDLFIAGESVHLDRLQAAGKIAPRQRRRIAANGLAIIALADTDFSVERPHDLLADRIRRLAVADPAAPLGHSTLDYLVAQRLHDSLRAKYVVVDHARAVVTAVASGAADAGVCFSSDAARTPDCRTLFSIPASQAGVQYEAAVIGGGRQPSAAKSLLTFLSSPPATRILRRNGFRPRSKAQ